MVVNWLEAFSRIVHNRVVNCCAVAHGPDYLSDVLLCNHFSGTVAMATLLWEDEADLDRALISHFISDHLTRDLEVTVGEVCEQEKT